MAWMAYLDPPASLGCCVTGGGYESQTSLWKEVGCIEEEMDGKQKCLANQSLRHSVTENMGVKNRGKRLQKSN